MRLLVLTLALVLAAPSAAGAAVPGALRRLEVALSPYRTRNRSTGGLRRSPSAPISTTVTL